MMQMDRAAASADRARSGVFALRRFVYPPPERCELCRASLPAEHAHLLEVKSSTLRCACKSCLEENGDHGGEFLQVRPRKEKLRSFGMSDAEWNAFQIPIDLAFLVRGKNALQALYPGPAGMIQSMPNIDAWEDVATRNPVLRELAPDVEALLVNRVRGRKDAYRVSIDHCYALGGIIRSQWHGLSGGSEVWDAIEDYFAEHGPHAAGTRVGHA